MEEIMSKSSKNPYGNKTCCASLAYSLSLSLAKIHMVTKLKKISIVMETRLSLAKIHMVTKRAL